MIQIEYQPPVCLSARKLIRQYFKYLPIITPPKYKLQVIVYPDESIQYIDYKSGHLKEAFGLFFYPPPLQIHLAGKPEEDEDITEWLFSLRDTICHEWVHYEQYLRGAKIQERGVKVRTRNLIRKVENIISHENSLHL